MGRNVPAVVVVALLTASLPALAEANGGTRRLDHARAGPYLVSLWTQPSPPRVGTLDVSLTVMRSPSNEAVLDARARLRAESVERGTTATTALSLGGGRNPGLYHGNLELPQAGAWRLTVWVEGPAGGGHADFELEVQPAKSLDSRLLLAAGLLVILAVWWTMFRSRPAYAVEGVDEDEARRDQPNGSAGR
ncbi:MAG: hypothetical protein ACRELA_01685 [Candidatus Rokuibacteriota bacterium]